MGLSKQDLDLALSQQTKKLAKNLEDIKESLSAQIMTIKDELDATKQKIEDISKEFEVNKSALKEMDEKVDSLRNEIENEVLAKLRVANQVWIGNVENLNEAAEMIKKVSDAQVQPKTIRAITGKQGSKKGKTLGCIAEFNDFEEKMAILKASSKLPKSANPKKIYLKSNQTKKERQKERSLREEVSNLRDALTDNDTEFPVIRNGKIVFLERRPQQNGSLKNQNSMQLEESHANIKPTKAINLKPKTRKNSKRNDVEETWLNDQIVITSSETET